MIYKTRQVGGQRQYGVGLPIAIFVITIMSAFAVNMGLLVQDNASARSEFIQAVRASLAADSGAELGMNNVFDPSEAPDFGSAGTNCSSLSKSYDFGAAGDPGMNGCTAIVSCSTATADGETIFTVTSVGACDGITRTVMIDAI